MNKKNIACDKCKTQLEKRILGVDIYYCCRNCLSIISAREIAKLKLNKRWLDLCA